MMLGELLGTLGVVVGTLWVLFGVLWATLGFPMGKHCKTQGFFEVSERPGDANERPRGRVQGGGRNG